METEGPNPTFAAAAGTPYAAEAAAETYRAGGNAVDAAVAAAAAVGVTEPLMSSIGGGGFAPARGPPGGAEGGGRRDVAAGGRRRPRSRPVGRGGGRGLLCRYARQGASGLRLRRRRKPADHHPQVRLGGALHSRRGVFGRTGGPAGGGGPAPRPRQC